MLTKWMDVPDFPDYAVSNYGEVYNEKTGKILKQSPNQIGILTVGLIRNGTLSRRSVATLVAMAFHERPRSDFNTVIHLDGKKDNCRADNLMWRTRPFAVRYHQDIVQDLYPHQNKMIEVVELGQVFSHIMTVARKFGLIPSHIYQGILSGSKVWPVDLTFRFHEN